MRKIVHVDMDAFYASVEQRDRPELAGKPVVVAWEGARSVVCAASYEARRFGVRSAMPALTARRQCPDAIFVPPDFTRYREVTRKTHEIFHRHTELVEPLSLDEAYLDVTVEKTGLPTATATAKAIRAAIREELSLTASAGVAPNKFLAKIASDWKKPDGLFVIQPHEVEAFLAPLPVGKIPGVGRATEERLATFGWTTVGELRAASLPELVERCGAFGRRLYELARGIDEHPVEPRQPAKSISSEDTFAVDLPLTELAAHLARAAERLWAACDRKSRHGRTVTVKLKTSDFRIFTRRRTAESAARSEEELLARARQLLDAFGLPAETRFRLIGLGISGFPSDEESPQRDLFSQPDPDDPSDAPDALPGAPT